MLLFKTSCHKRNLANIFWLVKTCFILGLLMAGCQAGVIKKRDTTESGNIDLMAPVQPTILTALLNASEVVNTTKLQSVAGTNFPTETSKELTNNEILINEAKKLLEEEDKIINSNNETELKKENEAGNDSEEHLVQTQSETKSQDNLQDIKQIIKQLENKDHNLGESSKTSTEFSSNDIKIDKMQKLMEKPTSVQDKEDESDNDNENSSSLENSIKPRPPSRILTELRTESPATRKPKVSETQLENSIEQHSKEQNKNELVVESNENRALLHNETSNAIKIETLDKVTIKSLESSTTLKTLTKNEEEEEDVLKTLAKSLNTNKTVKEEEEEDVLKSNSLETSKKEQEKSVESTTDRIAAETSTSVLKVTDNMEVLEMTTLMPDEGTENQSKPKNSLNQAQETNNIHDGLDREELLKTEEATTLKAELETTLQPMEKEEDLLIFDGDKKEYTRSMFMQETTTLNPQEVNEVLIPVTTFRPVVLSVKEGIEETTQNNLKQQVEEVNKVKEKKPKFINDNSTNAQQLNLPNNADVWSLAAMKSLPKANITMETAQTHNQTHKEYQETILLNNTLTMNSNSEKNLLDWSQIMRDKELSTTTRNEQQYKEAEKEKQENYLTNEERKTEDNVKDILNLDSTTWTPDLAQTENHLTNEEQKTKDNIEEILHLGSTTTWTPDLAQSENKPETREEAEATINSLIEPQLTSTTMATAILSQFNDNNNDNNTNNEPDKKVETNMNNHLENLMETLNVATTTAATNVDNHPFNTSLNIEPNLNEINLTSNQTQADLNNDVQTITTAAGKQSVDDDEFNADRATTTTTTTATEATAVADMTTVEQISSETTTVSTPETSKQNASLNNVAIKQQQNKSENNNNNNVNLEESNSSSSHNELENSEHDKQTNQYENIELNTNTTIETTTVVPITTFRPTILAITSTTSIPATFEQEVDQNGNQFQINLKQKQSITDLHDNNSTKTIETHLSEREFETTTHETITTTATELAASKTENTHLTSALENSTDTSSSKDELINETTEISLGSQEFKTTTQTTPKQVDETTIGSPVTTTDETGEKLERKETETETTPTTTTPESTGSTTSTTEATKTPVVVIDTTQRVAVTESFTPTTTEQNTISTTTATAKQEGEIKEEEDNTLSTKDANIETTTNMSTTTTITSDSTTTTAPVTAAKDDETYISLLDDTTTTQTYSPTISTTSSTTTPTTTTTTTTSPPSSSSTLPSAITTKVEEIYNVIHSTTTELIQTTTQQLLTETEEDSTSPYPYASSTTITSSSSTEMLPTGSSTTPSSKMIETADIGKSLPTLTSIMGGNSGNMYPKNSEASGETDVNVIIAITVSVIGVIALILLVGFLYLMRKRQKQNSYPNRCRPVSMDEFTIDNASVGGSMRKSSALRSSKRTYGNLAFDDPSLRHNAMGVHELAKFVQEKLRIFEEFRDVPLITSRSDEVPPGCEDKNRYANVLPLPETRVILQRLNDDDKTEYINANYVTGPKDSPNYYIACQAPLDSTVEDFWRMIWEQQSRVIIQATDLIENGVEKCAEYLPPSVTLDNHCSFGDFQITLQNREVKDKYAISTILLKNVAENVSRELTHYWYKWPEVGVPAEEAPIIAMLLEARSSLISYAIEQANEDKEKSSGATLKSAEEGTVSNNGSTLSPTSNSNGSSANGSSGEINGNISMVHIKKTARNQGPLTIHCSPGTGRTGTIIACDIAIRSLETPKRTVDIPQIVYYVRRGRASAVLTKEQYEFIYKVANMYAAKITNPTNYN
ncbi:serine-rich adhesin for platelets [Calliphora vicina]|uniref:serine-rich adhesin for platelets n=1 Tax=Calliphora vicina TaxID=7373 RepID=UPI00325C0CA2